MKYLFRFLGWLFRIKQVRLVLLSISILLGIKLNTWNTDTDFFGQNQNNYTGEPVIDFLIGIIQFSGEVAWYIIANVPWSMFNNEIALGISPLKILGLCCALKFWKKIIAFPLQFFMQIMNKFAHKTVNLIGEIIQAFGRLIQRKIRKIFTKLMEFDYNYYICQGLDYLYYLIDSIRRLFYRR